MRGIRHLVIGVALAWATAVSADTIRIDWNSPIFGSMGARDVGNVTHPGGKVNTDAGRFHGQVTEVSDGFDVSRLINSGSEFFAYCHDLAQVIADNAVYNVQYGASAIMRDFLGAVNHVLGGDPYAWLRPKDKDTAAAIQLGIWEALHNDDFNLQNGVVQFSTLPAGNTVSIFNSFVDAMDIADSLSNDRVMVLTNDRSQDVITGLLVFEQQVPEPGTLALLGIAALAVATGIRRRRR